MRTIKIPTNYRAYCIIFILGLVLGGGFIYYIQSRSICDYRERVKSINERLAKSEGRAANLERQLREERDIAAGIRNDLEQRERKIYELADKVHRLGESFGLVGAGIDGAKERVESIDGILQRIRERGKFKVIKGKD